ncbi:MAG: UDP-N-acetylmuramoyl-L-alanyl-D-glutamate--2,6-diaminopimelate ligase [Rhodospirillaceae bacterium]
MTIISAHISAARDPGNLSLEASGLEASGLEASGLEITGLTADSRAVGPGFLFAALPGSKVDGRAFLADALARGAVAVLAPSGTVLPAGSTARLIVDDEPRRAFALMAAAFYGRQPDCAVAVTGTNGKTSTVQFVRQLWSRLGHRAAALGTLGLAAGPGIEVAAVAGAGMTTPDPVALHAQLAVLAGAGVDHLAMEASSHGLDQSRLDGVRLKAAAFTNLSRDHLDYHGSMPLYLTAKALLFTRVLPAGGIAVLNADAAEFAELAEICRARGVHVLGYGSAGRELTVRAIEPTPHGQRLTLNILGHEAVVELGLVGRFQAWNALCALGLVLASDAAIGGLIALGAPVPADLIQPALVELAALEGVPGRMQAAGRHPSGAAVIVDYAHTPDALETVLAALRPHAARRLVVVFGCGGDRDRGKRPVMGEIAARLADRVIVTDDNPRSEVPAEIRRAVMAGCPEAEEIGDRAEAINSAVRALSAGDVLVIAGKGHEQGQIVGTEIRPFDDAAVARVALSEIARVALSEIARVALAESAG